MTLTGAAPSQSARNQFRVALTAVGRRDRDRRVPAPSYSQMGLGSGAEFAAKGQRVVTRHNWSPRHDICRSMRYVGRAQQPHIKAGEWAITVPRAKDPSTIPRVLQHAAVDPELYSSSTTR